MRYLSLLPLVVCAVAAPLAAPTSTLFPPHSSMTAPSKEMQASGRDFFGIKDVLNIGPQRAVVQLQGDIEGLLTLLEESPLFGTTMITGRITGLTPGAHGFHIHQTGNLTTGCTSTGGHYNPFERAHGAPTSIIRHIGDLGNIIADESGTAVVNIKDKHVSLVGPNSVIGRAVVVHAGPDDLGLNADEGSMTTGNAGARVGCGVIGRA